MDPRNRKLNDGAVLLCKAPNLVKNGFIPDSKREDPARTDSFLLATRRSRYSYPHCIELGSDPLQKNL
jgi:hypothetical protein